VVCASIAYIEARAKHGAPDRSMECGTVTVDLPTRVRDASIAVCVYAGLYIALDWLSFVHAWPTTGFTLWNPPPACSLAILLIKGLGFAPAVFVVSVISDGLVAGFSAGLAPTLVTDAIIAGGYAAVALGLQRLAHADKGFLNVTGVVWFLLITVLGVLAIAGVVAIAFVLMHALPPPPFASAVGHFWIGDLTGIAGLLPALMSLHLARDRWNELTPSQRFFDITAFVGSLSLALFIVFVVAGYQELHFFYLLLLPVIFVAVRHGLPWSAAGILVTQLAMISTVIALDYAASEFLAFQLLSLTVSATGLLVGAVVTERQRAEVSLRRQQAELDRIARLTTAGALGMAVVHQISQPLATIATYIHACRQLLRSDFKHRDTLADTMAKAEAEVLRTGVIVDRLRDFLSNGDRCLSPVDLGAVARAIVATLTDDARQCGADIRVDVSSGSLVMVDRIQIEQVLVNLIRNAIEAPARQDGRGQHVGVRIRDIGDEVEVVIEDDGLGVSPEVAKSLFEPFETSKHSGMGLGLWLSRELVEGHGGRLWWDPDTAAGARFVFRLPRNRANVFG
jgi:two-component system sensor kinase FixL